jgi:hypothetical protein
VPGAAAVTAAAELRALQHGSTPYNLVLATAAAMTAGNEAGLPHSEVRVAADRRVGEG